jgi:hypothetical protein
MRFAAALVGALASFIAGPNEARQNNEDVVIPFLLPCLPGIAFQLNKVWFKRLASQSKQMI